MTTSDFKLKLQTRNETGSKSSRRMRREGKIPVIIYGHQKEPKQCAVEVLDWQSFKKQDTQLAKVLIDNTTPPLNVLVKDIQHDYLAGKTLHIDFQEINMNEEITTAVPVGYTGTPAGTAEGGMLSQTTYEIEVSCLPGNLPDSIEVDVTDLELGDSLLIKDIVLPENVTCTEDPESTIFYVSLPKAQEEPEETEGEEEAEEGESEGTEGTEDKKEAKATE